MRKVERSRPRLRSSLQNDADREMKTEIRKNQGFCGTTEQFAEIRWLWPLKVSGHEFIRAAKRLD